MRLLRGCGVVMMASRRRKRRRSRNSAPDPIRELEQRERERKEMERMMSSHDTFQRRNGKVRPARHGYQERDVYDM